MKLELEEVDLKDILRRSLCYRLTRSLNHFEKLDEFESLLACLEAMKKDYNLYKSLKHVNKETSKPIVLDVTEKQASEILIYLLLDIGGKNVYSPTVQSNAFNEAMNVLRFFSKSKNYHNLFDLILKFDFQYDSKNFGQDSLT